MLTKALVALERVTFLCEGEPTTERYFSGVGRLLSFNVL